MTPPAAGVAVAYGVDVGGTKVLAVALAADGTVVAEWRSPTPAVLASPTGGTAGETSEALATVVEEAVGALCEQAGGAGAGAAPVGVGVPGLVSGGVLHFAPHLPRLAASAPAGVDGSSGGTDLVPAISARLQARFARTPVLVHNDANLAAVGEVALGSARGARHVLVITLGTGIGGAVVVDGLVRTGANGFAGEFGHMVVDPSGPPCPCGRRGCWERYASGGGLARLAREAALAGTVPAAVSLAGGHPELVRGEHVTEAARAGDAGALAVLDQLGWWLGLGLANLTAAFDPERLVLGGGLVAAGEMLLEPARRALASLVVGADVRELPSVLAAGLGERAGAIGAALAAGGLVGARPPAA